MAKATRPLDCVRYESKESSLNNDVSEHTTRMLMNDDDCYAKKAELAEGRVRVTSIMHIVETATVLQNT